MLTALTKSLAQASDPAYRRAFAQSLLAAFVVFVVLWVLAWFALGWLGDSLAVWVAGRNPDSLWVDFFQWAYGAASIAGVLVVSFFLFPAVMVSVMSVLLDQVAEAVERRHYPYLPPAREPPILESVIAGLGFAGVTLGLNILVLPLYLVLFFVPPLNLFVFYLLNGYLLGREYFELVAARRLDSEAAKRLRKANRGRVLLAGIVVAFLLTIPIVNIAMPLVATGFMLHIFERIRRRSGERAPVV